jgi:hypothetical protein
MGQTSIANFTPTAAGSTDGNSNYSYSTPSSATNLVNGNANAGNGIGISGAISAFTSQFGNLLGGAGNNASYGAPVSPYPGAYGPAPYYGPVTGAPTAATSLANFWAEYGNLVLIGGGIFLIVALMGHGDGLQAEGKQTTTTTRFSR